MHILMKFSKDVLKIWLCSIHPCICLQLWGALACHYHALDLLNIIDVSLLTGSAFLPCVLLVIHAPYDHALAMFSFINVSSYYWLVCYAMKCFVVSGTSLQSCYHESAPAMLVFSSKSETCSYHLPCLH